VTSYIIAQKKPTVSASSRSAISHQRAENY